MCVELNSFNTNIRQYPYCRIYCKYTVVKLGVLQSDMTTVELEFQVWTEGIKNSLFSKILRFVAASVNSLCCSICMPFLSCRVRSCTFSSSCSFGRFCIANYLILRCVDMGIHTCNSACFSVYCICWVLQICIRHRVRGVASVVGSRGHVSALLDCVFFLFSCLHDKGSPTSMQHCPVIPRDESSESYNCTWIDYLTVKIGA